jgi:co-chaperonin GroES (HSP10)
MKIHPISNYTIIKLDPADENIGNTKLIAPGQFQEAYNVPKRMGTVRAVGRGLVTAGGQIIPPQLKPGDRVYVLQTKVEITVEHEGEDCLVLSDESHVIGTITGESSLILGGK